MKFSHHHCFRPSKVQLCTLVGRTAHAFFIQLSDPFKLIIVARLRACPRLICGIKKSHVSEPNVAFSLN